MKSLKGELETLYEDHGVQFYHCALAVTQCAGLAEDAVHDAFQRAFQLKNFPDDLKAYVYRSVRNAAIDIVRRSSKSSSWTSDLLFEIPAPQLSELENREFIEDFTKALDHLTSDERETVLHHLSAQLTFQEISTLRDRPMGTVTSWYRRGIEKLKQQLKRDYGSI